MKQPKKMTPAQIAKIKELARENNSSYKIAKQMNIPPGVARYHIQKDKLSSIQNELRNKAQSLRDPDALHILRQQIERLDMKKKLLQEIIDQDIRST